MGGSLVTGVVRSINQHRKPVSALSHSFSPGQSGVCVDLASLHHR